MKIQVFTDSSTIPQSERITSHAPADSVSISYFDSQQTLKLDEI